MNEFRFENTLTLTEAEYSELWLLVPKPRWRGWIRLLAITAVGVALLFPPYTLLRVLGVIILGVVLSVILLPRLILPFGIRSTFRKHRYLRDALTYGVSEQKLWIKGPYLDASVSWPLLVTWRETADWLILSPSGIPPLYFSLARLREERLYAQVKELAKRYGIEFKASAQRRG